MRQGRNAGWWPVRLAVGLMAAMLLAVSGSGAWAKVQQAPSSRIAIDLPAGYAPSDLFTGFVNETLGVSLVVVEMPARAFEGLKSGMTPEALATKGVLNVTRGTLQRPDHHIYMRGEQSSPAGTYVKLFVAFKDGDVTALVTANVQKASIDAGLVGVADIEPLLASARVAAKPAPVKEIFALDYLGPFKPAGTFLGTTRGFTLDGSPVLLPVGATRPMLIVSPSLDRRPVEKPEEHAESLLTSMSVPSDVKVTSRAGVTYGGLTGVEIEATAHEREGSGEVVLYQVVLLAKDGGYFRIFGQAPIAERERYLDEFKKIAAGFRPLP